MTADLRTQYAKDRLTIHHALRSQPSVGGAADTIRATLLSRDIRNDWSDLLMRYYTNAAYESAGNQQDYLARTFDAPLTSSAEDDVKSAVVLRSHQYAIPRADGILDATARFIAQGIARQRGHKRTTAPAKPKTLPDDFSITNLDDLDQYIDFVYEGFTGQTASTLADHESATAGNGGQFIGASLMEGLTLEKVWSSVGDARTRPWHADMDGVSTSMDEPFNVDGEDMMYPLDDALGASGKNLYGCRCTTYYQPAS